tara:strand:- start:29249 stop:29620 length:372 start_codon:yes stop_codon:yes gene_type:complete
MPDNCKTKLGLENKRSNQLTLSELQKLRACRKEKKTKVKDDVKEKVDKTIFNVKSKLEGNKKRERSKDDERLEKLKKEGRFGLLKYEEMKRVTDSVQKANPNAKFIKVTNENGKRKITIGKNK